MLKNCIAQSIRSSPTTAAKLSVSIFPLSAPLPLSSFCRISSISRNDPGSISAVCSQVRYQRHTAREEPGECKARRTSSQLSDQSSSSTVETRARILSLSRFPSFDGRVTRTLMRARSIGRVFDACNNLIKSIACGSQRSQRQ